VRAASDPAARLLAAGWNELDLVNYPKAQRTFEQVLRSIPTPAQKAEAMFALAHLWQYRQPGADLGKAKRLYEDVVGELGEAPAAPLALMALARMADAPEYEKDRNRKRARELYREIIDRYRGHFLAEEAVLRLAMTYLEELGNVQVENVGVKLLRDFLARKPESSLAPVMHWELGNLYFNRREYRQAVREWIAADALDAKAPEGRAMSTVARAGLYFQIAKVNEKHLKDYATAAKWYEKIVTDVRRENRYYVAKVSAERCRKLAAQAPAKAASRPTDTGEAKR
jgi:TolA-binding protein